MKGIETVPAWVVVATTSAVTLALTPTPDHEQVRVVVPEHEPIPLGVTETRDSSGGSTAVRTVLNAGVAPAFVTVA